MTRPPFTPVSLADIATVSAQLGRPARDVVGTAPRLSDGTPFPTFYYLTHPAATAALSFLEATQVMNEYNQLLQDDEEIRARYLRAHQGFLADRESVGVVPEIAGISSGGMPERVKCLHALAAHSLAAGPGVNPIGDLALVRAAWTPAVCECLDYSSADA